MSNANIRNVIGLDPGSNTGIAILSVDGETILDVKTYTLELKRHHIDKLVLQDDVKKTIRYRMLEDYLREIYQHYDPVAIGRETAFSARYAQAFAELTRLTLMLDFAHYDYNYTIPYFKFAPKFVKSVFSMSGTANKDDMRIALRKHHILKRYYNDNMSEHEVDALAIAYITLLEYNKGEWE